VIAPDEDFGSGESSNPFEIGYRILKLHGPREVTGDKNGVFWPDGLVPFLRKLLLMILPLGAEDVHGFSLGGKVEISNCKNAHGQKASTCRLSIFNHILPKWRRQENRRLLIHHQHRSESSLKDAPFAL